MRARAEVPVAETVAIEPASEDDWEMLELNAEFLEEHLLTRVCKSLSIVVYFHNNHVRVARIVPFVSRCAFLSSSLLS